MQRIQLEPYCIKVKQDGRFVLLTYDQLNSDVSLPLCQVCRGIILEQAYGEKWIVVCHPFDRFFNYGDPHAAEINWSSAIVREKIDGSLIKFWCDSKGNWHMSTNGTIDAFKAEVSDNLCGLTFGNIVERALGCNWLSFCRGLDEKWTYMFELVSPDTQVTVHYKYDGLYYLGQRHNSLHGEWYNYNQLWKEFGIGEPKVYKLNSLKDCVDLVTEFSKDEEGVVVNDNKYNRIKIKSPEYLIAAHAYAANNNKLGLRTAVHLIRENKVDDFLAYAPKHRAKMELILAAYTDIAEDLYMEFTKMKDCYWMPKKSFVAEARFAELTNVGFNFVIWHYDNRENGIFDYLHHITEKSLRLMIKEKLQKAKEEIDDE